MDSTDLRRAARWKYELGRLWVALPAGIAALVLVVGAVSLWRTMSVLGVGALLVALSLGYGFWGRWLARAVFLGLGAALIPLVLPSVAMNWGLARGVGDPATLCLVACVVSGGLAGAIIVWTSRWVTRGRRPILLAAGLLAAVGGALTCIQFETPGVLLLLSGLGLVLAPCYALVRPQRA